MNPGFSEGGSELGMDQKGGANPSIILSLKQGVWGVQPSEAMWYLILFSTKPHKMQDWGVFKLNSNLYGVN